MDWLVVTRYVNVVLYVGLFIWAQYRTFRTKGIHKFATGGVALAALFWAIFYSWIALSSDFDVAQTTLLSRVLHFQNVVAFAIFLNAVRISDTTVAEVKEGLE